MEPNINDTINRDAGTPGGNVHRLYPEDRVQRSGVEASHERSWKFMLEQISLDLSRLWERERLLISSEIGEKVSEAKTAVISIAAGAALCFVGLIAAVFAGIFVLELFMPLWLSAVILTVLLFAVGGVMIGVAKKRLEASKLKPRHSIETLGEIKTTLKERVHEFRH